MCHASRGDASRRDRLEFARDRDRCLRLRTLRAGASAARSERKGDATLWSRSSPAVDEITPRFVQRCVDFVRAVSGPK
jgi:hypothetical protein